MADISDEEYDRLLDRRQGMMAAWTAQYAAASGPNYRPVSGAAAAGAEVAAKEFAKWFDKEFPPASRSVR